MIAAAPPAPPAALVLTAPAEREVSFGRVAGRLPAGKWVVVVRSGTRALGVRRVVGSRFDFRVSMPRRDGTVRVTAYAAGRRTRATTVRHVLGLPRAADPRPVAGSLDGPLGATVRTLGRSFPGTSAVYVRDLENGRGAAWNAKARFPAGSTLKVAIAVQALRATAGKPPAGSSLDGLLRRMLIESDNDAANSVEALVGGGSEVDALLRGLGIGDTWMGGGYLRGTAWRRPIPIRVDSQPSFPCCKYTSAYDLSRLFTAVHLAAGGRGPLSRVYGSTFTPSDARYLLYLLSRVPDRGKLGRFIGGGSSTLLHKAGWISTARHDAGLVYWPGGVYVAVVMTWGRGVGIASDVLAGRVAVSALKRFRQLG